MPDFPDFTHWHFIAALVSAFAIGVSKGGIKGITIVFVALMAYAFGSKASTGLILPILIVGDVLAVIYYNRHCRWKYIVRLMPWMMFGVIVGFLVGVKLVSYFKNQQYRKFILVMTAIGALAIFFK